MRGIIQADHLNNTGVKITLIYSLLSTLYSSTSPTIQGKSMAGGSRSRLKARDHVGTIIFLVVLENMFSHHASGTTAPVTKAALEQDPQMLQAYMIVCPIC